MTLKIPRPNKDQERQRELQQLAESYVRNADITAPPVDPVVWCRDPSLIRVHVLNLGGECDGLLLFRKGRFHLFYHPDPHRWRFTFAHEVGHYLVEEHHQAIRLGRGEHNCRTGFVTDLQIEREADWFASALLMPSHMFEPRCPDPNFKDISKAAEIFQVSLTAAVLRTIVFTRVRTGVIVTVAGKIKWYFLSDDMVYSGVHSPKVGPLADAV